MRASTVSERIELQTQRNYRTKECERYSSEFEAKANVSEFTFKIGL